MRSKNYIRSTMWAWTSRIIMILFPFVVRTVLIYSLGVQYVGLNSLFTTILQVLSLAELGIGSAIVYSMYKPAAEGDEKTLGALLNLYKKIYRKIGIAILIIAILCVPFLKYLVKGDVPADVNLYILYAIYIFNTVSSYFMYSYRASLFSAFQRNDIKNKIMISINIIYYLFQIFVLIIAKNFYLYIILLPISTVANNLLTYKISKKLYPSIKCEGTIDKKEVDGIRKKVYSLLWHKIGNTIIFSFDNVVISSFIGLTVLGIYNNYYYVYNAVAGLFSAFYESITPGIGNSLITEKLEKNRNDFYEFNTINFALVSICATLLLCLYQPFMFLWQGQELMLKDTIVILLVILFVVWHSRRMIHTYKDAAGLWKIDEFRPITEALLNLTLNIALVNVIGLPGIVISTIISMAIVGIPWEINAFIKKYLKSELRTYYIMWLKNIIKIALVCFLSYSVCSFIKVNNLLSFIELIMLSLICSVFFTFVLYRKETVFKKVIKIVRRR